MKKVCQLNFSSFVVTEKCTGFAYVNIAIEYTEKHVKIKIINMIILNITIFVYGTLGYSSKMEYVIIILL